MIRSITIVSSANLTMMLDLCVVVQLCVYREYRSGLRMQPWGAPVLRIRGDEVLLPILTTWLLPVRKSRIHLHRDLFSPRVWSFATSVAGTMVLNAEHIVHEQNSHIGVDCFCLYYVLYTLPDETRYSIWIRLYVIIRRCPEHVPVHLI